VKATVELGGGWVKC